VFAMTCPDCDTAARTIAILEAALAECKSTAADYLAATDASMAGLAAYNEKLETALADEKAAGFSMSADLERLRGSLTEWRAELAEARATIGEIEVAHGEAVKHWCDVTAHRTELMGLLDEFLRLPERFIADDGTHFEKRVDAALARIKGGAAHARSCPACPGRSDWAVERDQADGVRGACNCALAAAPRTEKP